LYALTLTVAIMTMILTPIISGSTTPLYALRKRWFEHESLQTINLPQTGLQDHVVIAGGGRVGQHVAQVLQHSDLTFVIVEMDYRRVEQARAAGFPIIYGDAAQEIVLEAARVEHACLVLVTTPAIIVTQSIVGQVRRLNPAIHIVARAEGVEQMQALHSQGVYEVVQPEFEAGLEITRQALLHLNISATDIQRFTDAIRQELYAPLYQRHSEYQTVVQLQNAARLLELTWLTLPPDSPLIGRTIHELKIRSHTGVSVVGVMRDGEFYPNPDASYQFTAGDLVAVIGNPEQLADIL
jgi:CPA2 family monovalent cation:H+ antiporter-2